MNRRTLLKGAAAAAVAATWPSWLRAAFAADQCAPGQSPISENAAKRVATFTAALRAATKASRPLMVFVIPARVEDRWQRGHFFGEYLNQASDAQLHWLAPYELTCARMKDLRNVLPSAPSSDPLMLAVETDAMPAKTRALTAEVPDWGSPREKEDPVERRIALAAELVRKDAEPSLAAWSARTKASLSAGERQLVSSGLKSGKGITRALAERAAAWLEHEGASPAIFALLAAAVRARTRDQRPSGARWATSEGCGVTIEGEPADGTTIGCGMGFTPERSKRFLYFFSGNGLSVDPGDED